MTLPGQGSTLPLRQWPLGVPLTGIEPIIQPSQGQRQFHWQGGVGAERFELSWPGGRRRLKPLCIPFHHAPMNSSPGIRTLTVPGLSRFSLPVGVVSRMQSEGFEPSCREAPPPQDGVSAVPPRLRYQNGWIRTSDFLRPREARYQAALRSVNREAENRTLSSRSQGASATKTLHPVAAELGFEPRLDGFKARSAAVTLFRSGVHHAGIEPALLT